MTEIDGSEGYTRVDTVVSKLAEELRRRLPDGSTAHCRLLKFFFNLCGGTTALLYRPRMIGDGDCGEIGGMKIDKGNLAYCTGPG
jgi:hypothetical protein